MLLELRRPCCRTRQRKYLKGKGHKIEPLMVQRTAITNYMLMIINDRKSSAIVALIEKLLGARVPHLAYGDPSDNPTGFRL